MSSSSSQTWCPTCLEHCTDHPSICTICGDSLSVQQEQEQGTTNDYTARTAAVPVAMTPAEFAATGRRAMMSVRQIDPNNGQDLNMGMGVGEEVWQAPPPEAMDPQSENKKLSSTSKKYLNSLERITIHSNSAILHQATVIITVITKSTQVESLVSSADGVNGDNDDYGHNGHIIDTQQHIFQATIGEFKPHPPFSISGPLYLSKPVQGTDPISVQNFSGEGHENTPSNPTPLTLPSPSLLFMERGRNTFIQKSINASSVPNMNVQGIICSNNNSTWPYTMKDSTGRGGIIPIVMVQQSDGQRIHSLLKKQQSNCTTNTCTEHKDKHKNSIKTNTNINTTTMTVQAKIDAVKKSNDQNSCIICTDTYKINEKIIQLPQCKHFFHENCILHWLESHNTCPYCRKELPLEDEKEEDERRRRATSASANSASAIDDGPGRGRGQQQWESIFG